MSTALQPSRLTSRSIGLAIIVALVATLVAAALLVSRTDTAPARVPPAQTQGQVESGGDAAVTASVANEDGCHPASAQGRIEGLAAPAGPSDCRLESSSLHPNFFE